MPDSSPPQPAVDLDELVRAVDWVSAGEAAGMHADAFIDRSTGAIHRIGERVREKPPADLHDEDRYVLVPHRHDFELGRALALRFILERLPLSAQQAQAHARERGAFGRLMKMVDRAGLRAAWQAFEAETLAQALRAWCGDHHLPVRGEDACAPSPAAPVPSAASAGAMQPRITLITLAVEDLERALRFYRDGLGWPTQGVIGQEFEHGAVAFFDLAGGLRLALWPRASLAHHTGLPAAPAGGMDFCLAHNVAARAEVDAAMAQAQRAGATVVKPPHETFWGGYAGYFRDPDGHLWEVAFNPALNDAQPPAG